MEGVTKDALRSRRLWLLGLIAFAYLYNFPFFEGLHSPNENARIYMVKAVVEHKTLSVDQVIASGHPYVVDLARKDGHLYSIKAPGPSLLGIPFYFLIYHLHGPLSIAEVTYLLRMVASTLPSLIFLPFFFRFLGNFSADRGLQTLAFLAMAIGSMFFTHALLLAGHQTATVSLASAFIALATNRRRAVDSKGLLALSGFTCAFGVSSEYQAFFAGLAIALYGLIGTHRKTSFTWFILGALPPTLLTGLVHYLCYGSPFLTGHHFPAEATFQRYQECGWRGIFCFSTGGLFGTFLSPQNGLFFYAPWLIFLVPGLFVLFRRKETRLEGLCIFLVIASYFLTISGMYAWKGGWSVGPRYLGVTVPFSTIAVLAFLDHLRNRPLLIALTFLPLWLVGMVLYGLSSPIFPHFPEWLMNPFFEFLLPLLKEGRAPYNWGQFLGLLGFPSLIPYFAALLALIFIGLSSLPIGKTSWSNLRRSFLALALSLPIFIGLLWAMAIPRTANKAEVESAINLARSVWEPKEGFR